MGVYKSYIETDVYTEAKKRIKHIIMTHDSVLVCFSGGKDSLVVLCLVEEVYKEMGIKEKIKVVFRDEEVIPDDVVKFVQEKAESGKYDFRYYAIPLESEEFILGNKVRYVQWDRNRKHMRQPPAYAITLKGDEYREYSQYDADSFICKNEKGRVALINGIRSDESILRFRACVNKLNENYINATKDPRIKICKPIYDWSEQDIFLYFYKTNTPYCVIYDLQTINGDNLRVSTPLHAESAKRFYKLKTLYPTYYQQLIELFPEMILQANYWHSLAREDGFDGYEHTFEGIRQYARDHISDPDELKKCIKCIDQAEHARISEQNRNKQSEFGGYPLYYILRQVITGAYKRGVFIPSGGKQPKKAYEFEGMI